MMGRKNCFELRNDKMEQQAREKEKKKERERERERERTNLRLIEKSASFYSYICSFSILFKTFKLLFLVFCVHLKKQKAHLKIHFNNFCPLTNKFNLITSAVITDIFGLFLHSIYHVFLASSFPLSSLI